jgi:hypothetical protein
MEREKSSSLVPPSAKILVDLEPDGLLKVITPEGEVKTYSRMSKRSSMGTWKVPAMI